MEPPYVAGGGVVVNAGVCGVAEGKEADHVQADQREPSVSSESHLDGYWVQKELHGEGLIQGCLEISQMEALVG